MTNLGPVSAVLEADLRDWVRKHGIVLWLDVDNHYSAFVDSLRGLRASGVLPYEVQAFRGSHLELMLALETLTGGIDRPSLLIHLPGFTEEAVHASPLLGAYVAGVRYRKALPTLVTEAAAGRVRPEQIAAFLEQGVLTLDAADAWLAAILDDRDGGLSAQLRAMSLPAVIDDLLTGGFVAGQVKSPAGQDAVWDRLTAGTGLAAAWRDTCLPTGALRAEDVAFAAASWALCVEYVDDLRRDPVDTRLHGIRELPRLVRDACRELAGHLRDRQPGFYQRTADETEAWLTEELEAARAEELGASDTFRFEEDSILKAALKALSRTTLGRGPRLVARPGRWQLVLAPGRSAKAFGLGVDQRGGPPGPGSGCGRSVAGNAGGTGSGSRAVSRAGRERRSVASAPGTTAADVAVSGDPGVRDPARLSGWLAEAVARLGRHLGSRLQSGVHGTRVPAASLVAAANPV